MRINQARLTLEELHQVKWLMGGFLALLAFWAVGSLDISAELLLGLGTLAVLVAVVKPALIGELPPVVWRMAGPAILLIIVADFTLSAPDFLPALVRMVILLLVYRTVAPRRRREDLQLILLCLFCLVVSGVLTVSLLFAFQILLFTPLAMAFLFVISLLNRGPEPKAYEPDWKSFKRRQLWQRVCRVIDYKTVALVAALFGIVVIVSTVIFIMMPRFNLDQDIPFLRLSTQGKSGFSESVSLGDVSEIMLDESVALQIDVPSLEAMDPSPYWRMLVLDQYRDGNFSLSTGVQENRFRESETTREMSGWGVSESDPASGYWTFYLEGGTSRYLPLPGGYRSIRFNGTQRVYVTDVLYLMNIESVRQNVFSYQLRDLQWTRRFPAWEVETEAFARFEANGRVDETDTFPLTMLELNLSDADRSFLSELNQTILKDSKAEDASHYSQLVTDYLWRNFSYSLQPNGRGAASDPIVSWLKRGSQGHCELFAGSLILLAREAGYPARMVTGFAGGAWNTVQSYFLVRNKEAHAWVEIYNTATEEWVRVDPTPGSGNSDPDAETRGEIVSESGWNAWLDGLRVQWYRRIVNFEQDDQVKMATSFMKFVKEFFETVEKMIRVMFDQLKEWLETPLSSGNFIRIFILSAFSVGVYFFWRARFLISSLFAKTFKRPQAMDPVRRESSRYLKRFSEYKKRGSPVGGGEDARRFGQTEAALKALRFGPPVKSAEANPVFKQARKLLRQRG